MSFIERERDSQTHGASHTRHSVEAMRRFEDFWVKWDSDKILDELERQVEVIEIMSD